MKTALKVVFGGVLLLSSLMSIASGASNAPQDSITPKQDIKDAGKSTKTAAKKTGSATKKESKKVANKSAQKTKDGANKVEEKTQPNQ